MKREDSIALEYSAPIVVFGLLTMVEGWLPQALYPFAYTVKMFAVTTALVAFRRPRADIRWTPAVILPSVGVGILIIAMWLAIDRFVPYPRLGDRAGFDPSTIQSASWRAAFLAVRLYGLILLVPVMEEIFLRSFVLRFATRADFLSLPIGAFSATGLAATLAFSALSHPEWPAAVLAGVMFAFWLRRTRSLLASIVAHATANAALGAYVLATQEWHHW